MRDPIELHPENHTGDRVKLVFTADEYTRLKPGSTGTVHFIDALGTLHVDWDDGRALGLVPGEDRWVTLDAGPEPAP